MTLIELKTEINADVQTCFDLARDVDIHKLSTTKTKEKAIAGRTSGLCDLGDHITWEAVHFGIKQRLSVEIIKMRPPLEFEDRMTKGAFKSMHHKHIFRKLENKTLMLDYFQYEVPFGIIGKIFNKIILKKYMINFLKTRNKILKEIAEQRASK